MEFDEEGMNHELDMIEHIPTENETSVNISPNEMQLPQFSHLLPSTILGCRRWPTSLEAQAFPLKDKPLLNDVFIWVAPYLEIGDNQRLKCTGKLFQRGPGFGPLWFTRPWLPRQHC